MLCTRCKTDLFSRPHWTNLLLHKDCLEANEREVEARQALEKAPLTCGVMCNTPEQCEEHGCQYKTTSPG